MVARGEAIRAEFLREGLFGPSCPLNNPWHITDNRKLTISLAGILTSEWPTTRVMQLSDSRVSQKRFDCLDSN